MAIYPYGRLVWSFQGNLTGAGTKTSPPIDIHDVTDLWLAASVTGTSTGTTPTLNVQVDLLDNSANVFPAALALTQITTAPGHASGSAGMHIASPGSIVLPMLCQVSYVVGGTNPVYPGVTLSLFGR